MYIRTNKAHEHDGSSDTIIHVLIIPFKLTLTYCDIVLMILVIDSLGHLAITGVMNMFFHTSE